MIYLWLLVLTLVLIASCWKKKTDFVTDFNVGHLCRRKAEGLWWEDDPEARDRCELLDVGGGEMYECGICGAQEEYRRHEPRCNHYIVNRTLRINLRDRNNQLTQYCALADSCKLSFWREIKEFPVPSCKFNSPCKSGFSLFKCVCPTSWYGMECNKKAKPGTEHSYAKGIDVLYDLRVKVSHDLPVIIAVEQSGDDISIDVSTELGETRYKYQKTLTEAHTSDSTQLISFCENTIRFKKFCSKYLRGSTKIYFTQLQFPMIKIQNKPIWYYRDTDGTNFPIGYETSFSVTVKNSPQVTAVEEPVFFQNLKLFVDYPLDIGCYRYVEIVNCPGGTINKIFAPYEGPEFEGRKSHFRQTIVEPYLEDRISCYKNNFMKWQLFRELKNGTSELVQVEVGEYNTRFEVQKYIVEGDYTIRFSSTILTIYGELENFAICSLRVIEDPLTAIIAGGDKRTINMEDTTLLDGSDSFDPNVKPEKSKRDLIYQWSCEEVLDSNNTVSCLKNYFSLSPNKHSTLKIPPRALKIGHEYIITLMVSKRRKKPGIARQYIVVALDNLYIECLRVNCIYFSDKWYTNPFEYVYLKATSSGSHNLTLKYVWDYAEDNGPYGFTDSISVDGTSKGLLKIGKNKLQVGKVYHFRVVISGTNLTAGLSIITVDFDGHYDCTLEPSTGIVGLTLFNLSCTSLDRTAYQYELYDKSDTDLPFYYSGRMIGTRGVGQPFRNFRLTRGVVIVLLFFKNGIGRYKVDVNLAPFNGTTFEVKKIAGLKDLVREKSYEHVLNTASVIPDIITSEMNVPTVVNDLVKYVYQAVVGEEGSLLHKKGNIDEDNPFKHVLSLAEVKLSLSSISYILNVISKKYGGFWIEVNACKTSAEVLLKISDFLKKRAKNLINELTLTQSILIDMINTTFNSVETLLAVKNPSVSSKPLHLVNEILLETVQSTSQELVKVLYHMSETVVCQQLKGDSFTTVISEAINIKSSSKADDPKNLNLTLNTGFEIPLRFSTKFCNSAMKYNWTLYDTFLGVQLTVIKINPLWWGSNNINTNVFLLEMYNMKKDNLTACRKRSNRLYDAILYFDIKESVNSVKPFEGEVLQLDSSKDSYDLDLQLTVYRFDPPVASKLFVRFIFSNPGNNKELRVLLTENIRPDYDMMKKRSKVITPSNTVYNVSYKREATDRFIYMGILPGEQTPTGSNETFKVKVYYTHCKTWLDFTWGSYGCWVGDETNDTILECDCNHFSLFGGLLDVPLYFVNPATDYLLFLTDIESWVPILCLLLAVIIFLLVLIWGRVKDKRDLNKGVIILLEDNYPGEKNAYLVGVYTGSRLNASTDANVGIRIFGAEDESRPHILKSSTYKTLRGNSDDWFLLYCPTHLGKITSLALWHDNTGKSPDWFVERIEIFDIKDKVQYVFELNVWIALEVDEYPEAVVTPSSMEEYYSVKKVFINNVVTGLRDTNYWTSVFWKNPRNPVSRVERVCVLLCFVLVAISCSLVFYVYFKGDVREDDPSFSFTITDLIIFCLTLLLASLAACLVMFLFRKSFSHKYMRMPSSFFLKTDSPERMSMSHSFSTRRSSQYQSVVDTIYEARESHYSMLTRKALFERYLRYDEVKLPKERTPYEHFAFALYTIVRGSSLAPVRFPNYETSLKVNRLFFVSAWVTCIIVCLISAIIILVFGFKVTKVRNEKWIASSLLVILFDAVIFSTAKVLLYSLILGFVFQRLVQTTNYCVKARDGKQRHLVGNMDHLYKLLELRSKPMYCPLSKELQEKYRMERIRKKQQKSVIDFFVLILLLVVLFMVTSFAMKNRYLSNNHTVFMLTHSHKRDLVDFMDTFNRTDLEKFLVYGLTRELLKSMWYNDFSTDEKTHSREEYWAYDRVMRLLGNALVRQIRVDYGSCPQVKNVEVGEYCVRPHVEIKDTFGEEWHQGEYSDAQSKSPAWRYTSPEESNSSAAYGPTRTFYFSGGYIEDIGYFPDDVRRALGPLMRGRWLDHLTRAVFVEITLYNVNTKLFNQVVLLAEQTLAGQYLTTVKVESITLEVGWDFWQISYIIFQLFFIVRMCVLMNRIGVFEYFSKSAYVFEVFLQSLGVSTVVLYFIHLQTAKQYLQEFQSNGMRQFFSFYNLTSYTELTRNIFCILFACVIIRLFMAWRFGRTYFTFYYTLLLSWPWIVWLTIWFALGLVIIWKMVGYLVNSFIFAYYTVVIIYRKDFLISGGQRSPVLVLLMCVLSYLVVLVFITLFLHYYRVAKQFKLLDTDDLNIYTVLKSELKRLKNRKTYKNRQGS